MFVISDEDHTLGNALRHVAAGDEKVQVAAYSIPHPLENKLRVQIKMNKEEDSAQEAIIRALDSLQTQIRTCRSLFEA